MSCRDGSNEGSLHNFSQRNKKNYLQIILSTPILSGALIFNNCPEHWNCLVCVLVNSYTMDCSPVQGDDLRALVSGLSCIQSDKLWYNCFIPPLSV